MYRTKLHNEITSCIHYSLFTEYVTSSRLYKCHPTWLISDEWLRKGLEGHGCGRI